MISNSKSSSLCLLFAISIFIIITVTAQTAAAAPLVFEYHGWHVDLTNAKGAEPDAKMIADVKRQLDIVEHVNLKPQVLEFMRTVRIWANPANKKFGPGHYGRSAASICV